MSTPTPEPTVTSTPTGGSVNTTFGRFGVASALIAVAVFYFALRRSPFCIRRRRRRREQVESGDRSVLGIPFVRSPPPPSRPIIPLPKLDIRDHPPDDVTESCLVCLDPLRDQPIAAGPCGHWLHHQCLHAWLVKDSSHTCPACRQSMDAPASASRVTMPQSTEPVIPGPNMSTVAATSATASTAPADTGGNGVVATG